MCKEEPAPIAYGQLYPVFKAMEEVGRVQRGYFIENIEGIQFAMPGLTDDLRRKPDPNQPPTIHALSTRDPANLYGRVLPWPEGGSGASQPRREAGATVVMIQGEPALWLSPSAHKLITFPSTLETWDEVTIGQAIERLFQVHAMKKESLLEHIDGTSAAEHAFSNTLEQHGAKLHPSGLLLGTPGRHARR
jgi:ATP-dependent Lhr-like helicase